MPLPTKHLFALFRQSISTAAEVSAPTVRCSNKIHGQYKLFVVQESQKALTEYLHATQGLPFFFADQIANNSLFSISKLLRNVRFSAPDFPTTVRKYLRYQAINEFEFFFESIGIDHRDIPSYLPRDRFFLSADGEAVLESSMALFQFGFPWNTLGRLYAKKVSIFNRPGEELAARLDGIRDYCGFRNSPLVGVCLAFPELLVEECGDFEALFEDVKMIFKKFDDNGGFAEGDLDGWYEVCCKLRFLYELGCERGKVWELMCSEKRILLDCPKRVLEDKADYFCSFCVEKKDKVGYLLLRNQELLGLDLRTPVISVSGVLEHFGLDAKELRYLSLKYPHVFGRNRMANLPGATRALDLHEWFFDKIESSGSKRFATYAIDHCDREVDQKFQDAFTKLESKRCRTKITTKLDFLMGLGFGENESTVNVLRGMQAANGELQERFDHLLSLGIKYSEVCAMMKTAPRILCLTPELVKKKIDYLCNEIGSSIKSLDPRVLVHDLENRIKPRHRFFVWLGQNGLCSESYSIKSIIDLSEKRFIALVLSIHRAAPKLYLECYTRKS